MDWKNAARADLPLHGQEVLIAVNDIKYVASFDAIKRGFSIRDGELKFVALSSHTIYWTEIKKHGA